MSHLTECSHDSTNPHPFEARGHMNEMIRKLVPQLDCTPFGEGQEKGYRFSGDGSYGPLLSGESSATKCGVPNGIRGDLPKSPSSLGNSLPWDGGGRMIGWNSAPSARLVPSVM